MFKNKTGIIREIRQSRAFKGTCALVLLAMTFEIAQPTVSLALTEGPSQPEVQSFEPINTTQMVDLFSGDFNYNIPLFNLPGPNGGYPFNLSYHAGISPEDEASWVGLGWNINAGSLVRNMRGLPDEFQSTADGDGNWVSGDYIETKSDMKESWTLGLNFSTPNEILGGQLSFDAISASLYFNNFRGLGVSVGPQFQSQNGYFSLGLSLDGENGLGVSPSVSLTKNHGDVGTTYRMGFTFDGSLSLNMSISEEKNAKIEPGEKGMNQYAANKIYSYGSVASFARNHDFSAISHSVNKYNLSFSLTKGSSVGVMYQGKTFGGFFQIEDYDDAEKKGKKRPVIGYSQERNVGNKEYFTKDFVRANDGQITKQSVVLPNSYYTYDSYTSTGQGLSGYFRGRRNDIGRVYDPRKRNENWGATLDLEFREVTDVNVSTFTFSVPPLPAITIPQITPIGTPSNHFGIGGSGSFGWDKQGPWDSDTQDEEDDLNQLDFDFTDPGGTLNGIRENHYYQAHGEQTILDEDEYDYINGLDLTLVKLSPKNADDVAGGKRRISASDNASLGLAADRTVADGKRVVRNTLIHNLRNDEVEKLGEYNIKYYNFNGELDLGEAPSEQLDREVRATDKSIAHHHAGYKVLNQDGSYYVYALPAYNITETENLFSVDESNPDAENVSITQEDGEAKYKHAGTHKFIQKTTKSPYPHSYMLTSVQGADYVDVTNNGPSDDDLGYWVKFDYARYGGNETYKWRAPYQGAQHHAGAVYTPKDDKGSYRYGEKEMWYLGRAETKTHIAIFHMSERGDAHEAAGEYANASMGTKTGLKLDRIEIYEKNAFSNGDAPIQTVHFQYKNANMLCQGSTNSTYVAGGKLTLEKIWFTGYRSKRKRNEYTFDYESVNLDPAINAGMASTSGGNHLVNPEYTRRTDPWGNVKFPTGLYSDHVQFPYTTQFHQGWDEAWEPYYDSDPNESEHTKKVTQAAQDLMSSAWCLRKITLPSGGTIQVDYESDDYGYVQHKTANQMFRITKIGNDATPGDNILYVPDSGYDFDANPSSRRIYFKLEHPIPESTSDIPKKVYDDYVAPITKDEAGNRNLYLKSKIQLTDGASSQVEDYVSGYLPIEGYSSSLFGVDDGTAMIDIEGDGTSSAVSCHTHGFITIQTARKKDGSKFTDYHPIALMGWNYMQTQAQELLNNPNSFDSESEDEMDLADVLGKIVDIMNFVPAAASSFGLVRKYCESKGFAKEMDLDLSCMRLASPDKRKFGGGHRVKQISITDNWSSSTNDTENDRTYGQRFEYTIEEETSPGVMKTISSGVAQYEPQIGGDENALKYPIHFYGKSSVFTSNNLFTEAPVNEDLFPGAMVGYRKVTVKSLNTDRQMRNDASEEAVGRTGGVNVHEFYTAKEFPTLVEYSVLAEENNTKDVFNLTIPIPLIGSIKRNYYHGTQAFKIETNDMHGKPKSSKSYELNDYKLNANPITTSETVYQCTAIQYQGEQVFQLDNYVNVINNDGTHDFDEGEKRLMGVEAELFTDQRESKTFYNTIGLEFNNDLPAPVLPLPSFWPSYSNHKTMFRTYVTNKVVHKTGIVKKVKSRDLQTVNESEIIAYDEKSGIPLLTKIKNEFGDNFYNYNIPAYYAYDGMGHAYRNINYEFCTELGFFSGDGKNNACEFPATSDNLSYLVRGDELLITDSDNASNKLWKAYFLGWRYSSSGTRGILYFPEWNPSGGGQNVCLKVIRSGRRNQFGVSVANYLTKGQIADQLAADHTWDATNGVTSKKIETNVLSATATLFRDNWTTSISDASNANGMTPPNPYVSGNSGIWRSYKSYTYVGERKTSGDMQSNATSDNPKLYEDGVMQQVPMFTWELNVDDFVSNWEWVSEVTRYNPDAYELENKNRLGIYSSALYGYNNSLSIGVSGNADYYESGVADFEMYNRSDYSFFSMMSQTNFNFDVDHHAGNTYNIELFNIMSATTAGGSNEVTIRTDIPDTYYSSLVGKQVNNVSISLLTRKSTNGYAANTGYYLNGKIVAETTYTSGTHTYKEFTLEPFMLNGFSGANLLPDNGIFYGKIGIPVQRPFIAVEESLNASYTSLKAHSGKQSIAFGSTVVLDQPKVKFKEDKKYIFSAWVSRNSSGVSTYKPSSGQLIEIGTMTSGTFNAVTPIRITYSKVIEGWQKIDIEFTIPDSDIEKIPAFRFNGSSNTLFVDDVRVSPKTGGIMTYVYEPQFMRLSASLNADNYATFFYYDEEGNLHLKKQETEEGIFTISESRGYVRGSN